MELNKDEIDIMNYLIEETKPRLNKFKKILFSVSFVLFLFVGWVTYSYWVGKHGNISHSTSLMVGGLLYTLLGAAITAAGASYNTSTITLMSTTRYTANSNLFYQLKRTSIFTRFGLYIITFGFILQAAAMILSETIGL